MTNKETRLRILNLHASSESGSPYWIEFFENSSISIEEAAETPLLLPFMDVSSLRDSPIDRFIPKSVLRKSEFLITGETSGFSGKPITTAFEEDEFHEAFVTPFLRRAVEVGFPVDGRWLWAGPSGPHIIGKAVRAILKSVGGMDPFAIDFDPRWYNRLPEDSMSRKRYLNHVIEQTKSILERQNIDVLFTTPPIVRALIEETPLELRERIRGVHYGGVATTSDEYAYFAREYPNAVHLNGYGNSLFGVFLEVECGEDGIEYATYSKRVDLKLIGNDESKLREVVIGERGRVLLSRYDNAFLIINMLEREMAVRSERGLRDPQPIRSDKQRKKVIY